jgi:hypothetical protein
VADHHRGAGVSGRTCDSCAAWIDFRQAIGCVVHGCAAKLASGRRLRLAGSKSQRSGFAPLIAMCPRRDGWRVDPSTES